jgi:two-component system CheB/CheR fusion protein
MEDLERSNRELQENNDRLVAALEELQSLNLALQSVNDALHGTNLDLRSSMDTLKSSALDLERMLNAVDVGVVLVDSHLGLRGFNAPALRFMSLAKPDIGKPIRHLRHDLGALRLPDLCRQALLTGEAVERVLTSSSGESVWFVAREVALGSPDPGLMLTFSEVGKSVAARRSKFA